MKKIVLLVSLLVPVLALASAAQDGALEQLSGDKSAALSATAAPLPGAVIPAARPWPSYPPPPPPHARMNCRAYDSGWEEHWGGHGGGSNEMDACRDCLAKHGSCRFDCTVEMVRCDARFNPYNQPQPPQPYPPAPYPPAPYPPAPYPPAPYPPAPYPPQPWNPAPPQPWNPGHGGYPPPPPGHWTPSQPGYPPIPHHPPIGQPHYKSGPGLYSGDLRPDQRSAEDSAIRNCTQANYGVPGYCSISTCSRQPQSVKSGRCR